MGVLRLAPGCQATLQDLRGVADPNLRGEILLEDVLGDAESDSTLAEPSIRRMRARTRALLRVSVLQLYPHHHSVGDSNGWWQRNSGEDTSGERTRMRLYRVTIATDGASPVAVSEQLAAPSRCRAGGKVEPFRRPELLLPRTTTGTIILRRGITL